MAKPPTSTRSIRLRTDQWADLTAAAERAERSVNYLVGQAVDFLLAARAPKGPSVAQIERDLIAQNARASGVRQNEKLLARLQAQQPAPKPWSGGHPKPGAKKR